MDALVPSDVFLGFPSRSTRPVPARNGGAFVPVKIGSRALDIIRILIERAGDLVLKDEIITAVWPGMVVEDSNLTVQIAALRHILDQSPAQGPCIQTVAGRGYRFVTAVTRRAMTTDRTTFSIYETRANLAARLSIVVLPFANLSNDPEQQYFADGITEDLTADLSRIDGSFVISRNTAFTYRGKPVETRKIGRELSVRYVLEGSIRRSGRRSGSGN
jgi:DNA-binding winged helix-turn-helix (wHTH) protein